MVLEVDPSIRIILNRYIVNLDKSKFIQVIRNLISNALKFSPPGSTVDIIVDIINDENCNHIINSTTHNNHHNNIKNYFLWKKNINDNNNSKKCNWLQIRVVDNGVGISEVSVKL
jgi:signal transduction histidine kinase